MKRYLSSLLSVSLFSTSLLAVSMLSGCSSLVLPGASSAVSSLTLAEPLQVNYQTEIMLMRYSQLILEAKGDNERQARLFYERGLLADSIGLRSLAHADFQRAMGLQPDFIPAYNFIGLYMTQVEQFDEAYDAYDSIEELDPDNSYVFLNRGIALYYGERYGLAIADLAQAYKEQPNDPFRSLWLYFPEYELNPEQALISVQQRYQQRVDDSWAWQIVALYAQQISETEFLQGLADGLDSDSQEHNQKLARRLTEAYFYLGKYRLLQGDKVVAANYFKLALANNVYEYIEHGHARLELTRLRHNASLPL